MMDGLHKKFGCWTLAFIRKSELKGQHLSSLISSLNRKTRLGSLQEQYFIFLQIVL